MNILIPEKVDALLGMFRDGHSVREIAQRLRISKRTVLRYRRMFTLPEKCRCGREYGHRGWCTERFHKSIVRQATLHPQKFRDILPRLSELWLKLPQEHKNTALQMDGGNFFKELSLKTKIQLLTCGWAWVEKFLQDELDRQHNAEEMHWLKESKRILREMGKLYERNRKDELEKA